MDRFVAVYESPYSGLTVAAVGPRGLVVWRTQQKEPAARLEAEAVASYLGIPEVVVYLG